MARLERRHTPRAPIHTVVKEEFQSEGQDVKAINISEHGMFYLRPLESKSCQGKEVFLTFSLLDRLEPMKVLAWIVEDIKRKEHIEAHVTFMFLPEKYEKMIQDYVTLNYKD